jgi:hypothetical protein
MNSLKKILLGSLLISGLLSIWSGCETDGYVGDGVYYGPQREPWFRDDSWMDGSRGYRSNHEQHHGTDVDLYISPPRLPSPPGIHHH